MGKLAALRTLLTKPVKVIKDGILAQNEDGHRKANLKNYQIEQLPSIDLLDLFPDFNETLDYYSFLNGTSLVTDLMLLKGLSKRYEDCEYFEIGSWRGESIANVAQTAKNCTSLTLSPSEMRELNFGEEFIKVHGIFSNGIKNIKTIEHNSHTFDFNSIDKKFDLIFIDGDHSYQGVINDSKKVLPLLKNENSIIVWHDYSYNTEDVRHSVLNGILDGVPKTEHHNLYHVSNTMCAIYMKNCDLKKSKTTFPTNPNKNFKIKLTANRL